MRLNFVFIALLFAATLGSAKAEQGCAAGFYPGGPANGQICVPIPGYGVTNNVQAPDAPEPSFRITWGAIAIASTGEVGATVRQLSRKQAKKEALSRCAGYGGKDCKVWVAYRHGCAAIAWPPVPNAKTIVQVDGGIARATEKALSVCKAKAGVECEIIYAECSAPV